MSPSLTFRLTHHLAAGTGMYKLIKQFIGVAKHSVCVHLFKVITCYNTKCVGKMDQPAAMTTGNTVHAAMHPLLKCWITARNTCHLLNPHILYYTPHQLSSMPLTVRTAL